MGKVFSNKIVQLVILIVIATALSIFLSIVKTKEYSDWISTDAVITDWRSAKGVRHILYFRYYVDDVEYYGQDSFRGNFPQNEIGDTVTVWYDPDNASRVTISDTKPDAGLWIYAPFIFAVPISLYIIGGGNKRNIKKLR